MYTLLALAVLAQPPADAPAPSGTPPEQALASIDGKGKLTITHVSCVCYGPAVREQEVTAQGEKGKARVSSVVVTTAQLPARLVEAYTVDGKKIEADKLGEMLAKERTVLVAMDGKKVDPFLLQLYKDGTIVLVPPANTLNAGQGGYGVVPYDGPVPVPPGPAPVPIPAPPAPPGKLP
jgi:hypothetical protein